MYDDDTIAAMRPRMFSIAYRMLGSVSEAEDVVQEAFLRQQRALADGVEIQSPAAYLSTVVTRLAIDELKSARADSLSWACLLLLERLSPVERAVFLLHDVFGYGFDEIAEIVGKNEANCRQLASRARRHVEEGKPRFEASRRKRNELAGRFFAAMSDGNLDGLVELLAADVAVYGDGGGKVPAWTRPITGVDHVGRLLIGLGRQVREYGARIEMHEVNGHPGATILDAEGDLVSVLSLEIVDDRVRRVRGVINPDKLHHLGPVADVRAALQRGPQ